MAQNNPSVEFISHKEAISRFSLANYFPLAEVEVSVVLLMNGDTIINEDFDDWYEREAKNYSAYDGSLMVIINGDLKVDGVATGKEDYNAHLLVLGDLYCDILRSYDEVSWITGNAQVNYVFDGNYNDGSICIEGILDCPYLINSDHSSGVSPSKRCVLICYHGHDMMFDYDVSGEELEEVLIPEIYRDEQLNPEIFYQVIKSGRSPFVSGFQIKKPIVK